MNLNTCLHTFTTKNTFYNIIKQQDYSTLSTHNSLLGEDNFHFDGNESTSVCHQENLGKGGKEQ